MSTSDPILVTGAAGQVGGIGRQVVALLRGRDMPVRALVRRDDDRAVHLRGLGAEVVIADLTRSEQVAPALDGCRRAYFGMSVSASYLEAALVMAAAARVRHDFELLVHMSQMTVSQMDLTRMTDSPQQRQHWLAEQALDWSGVPVTHVRPTVLQENPFFMASAAESIAQSGTIRLPFGRGRTSPVAARDVAEVVATVLLDPGPYLGRALELTGPRSADLYAFAEEYASALGRPVAYREIPLETWCDEDLGRRGLPEHVFQHLRTMAELHAANRYDRLTDTIERILRRPPTSLGDTVRRNRQLFQRSEPAPQRA
ncbi:MAG TPA: NAD(P)H-binding protein [Kofleriaceae bacterium]|nr:NAD(P)H-binding protein [Kofleriaceae bacterium]